MREILTRTTDPAETPVSVGEVKAALSIHTSDDDALITTYLNAAIEHLDGPLNLLGKSMVSQVWTQAQRAPVSGRLDLRLVPVISVDQITYYDSDNVQQTDTVSNYDLIKGDDFAYLDPKPGFAWPTTYDRDDALTVTVTTGYADASAVPNPLKVAIFMLIGSWYARREGLSEGAVLPIPNGFDQLINNHRVRWFGA